MKKQATLLLMLFAILTSFLSKEVKADPVSIFFENFDGLTVPSNPADVTNPILPEDWKTIKVTSATTKWTAFNASTYSYSGANSVAVGRSGKNDNWLFTPGISLTKDATYRISFYVRTRGNAECMKVYIGKDQEIEQMEETPLLDLQGYVNNGAPERKEVVFQATETADWIIGFHSYLGENTPDQLFMDDVLVEQLTDSDVAILEMTSPSLTSFYQGTKYDVEITFSNKGGTVLNNVNFTYDIGGTTGSKQWTGSLTPGKTETFKVFEQFEFADAKSYQINIAAEITNDIDPTNNAVSKTVVVGPRAVIPYTENFDNITPPNLPPFWATAKAQSDSYNWETKSDYPRSSPNALGLGRFSGAKNHWVFTPEMYFKKGSKYKLSFYVRNQSNGANYRELLKVHLGTSPSIADMNESTIYDSGTSGIYSSTYAEKTGEFTVEESGYYVLGFHSYGTLKNQNTIFIDDLSVTKLPNVDAAIESLISPSPADSYFSAGKKDIKVLLKNNGDVKLTSVNLKYKVGEGQEQIYNWTGELEEDQTQEVTVAQGYDFEEGDCTITVSTDSPNGENIDSNPDNNSVSASFTIYKYEIPFAENFDEENNLPFAWLVENINSNEDTWKVYTSNNYSFSEPNAIGIYSPSATALNDWLFTPEITPNGEDKYYKLSFYAMTRVADDSSENLTVYIGSNRSVDGMSATPILTLENMNNTRYEKYEAIFHASSADRFVIGFHARSENGYYLYIDDISIQEIEAYDAAITAILSPAELYTERSYAITAVLCNNGAIDLTEMDIEYDVDGAKSTYAWTGNLATGKSTLVTLASEYDFSEGNVSTITVTAKQANDSYAENDSFTKNFAVYAAYNVPFEENFDKIKVSEIPRNWLVDNVNNDAVKWAVTDLTPHSGERALSIEGSPKNDWVFTPEIMLEAGKSYSLSFWYSVESEANAEALKVYLGTMAALYNMEESPLIDLPSLTNVSYQEANHTFTVQEDGYYVLGFHSRSETSSNTLFVDDLSLTEVPDIAITTIVKPMGDIYVDTAVSIEATLQNNSTTTTVTTAKLSYSVDNSEAVTIDWTGDLAPGATASVTFDPITFATIKDDVEIKVCSSLPNGITDINPDNDCATTTINVIKETAINNPETQVSLHPNPFTDKICIDNSGQPIERVLITTPTGQQVMNVKLTDENCLSVESLHSGVYFITLVNQSGEAIVRKMLKK